MTVEQKLEILTDAAKYDASCASSGSRRQGTRTGNTSTSGICHSWSSDGRCISLLNILLSNVCIYDCAYCVNRRGNDLPRATFSVAEVVALTMDFYRRNYIEGLFLSSAVFAPPDRVMERMVAIARRLRQEEGFGGYIHLKAIPGASLELMRQAGCHADRVSVNIELPSEASLKRLAPEKTRAAAFPGVQVRPLRGALRARLRHHLPAGLPFPAPPGRPVLDHSRPPATPGRHLERAATQRRDARRQPAGG